MTNQQFDSLLAHVVDHITKTLKSKGDEYAFNSDRLSNFKSAALMEGRTPLQCLEGFALKHRVAYKDYINCDASNIEIPLEWWREKIFDQINYLILAWALIVESKNE